MRTTLIVILVFLGLALFASGHPAFGPTLAPRLASLSTWNF
jgi:hypothetical protein